jgi:hypothetical protein
MSAEMPRAIGSDFESLSVDALRPGQTPPWELAGPSTVYVETGRQALALIGATLRARGRNRLLVPSYLCESMISPFVRAAWQIAAMPLTADLRYGDAALAELGPNLDDTVLLLASYFGRDPDGGHIALAREARARGAVIVEDETHRVFRPGSEIADISFASLRKLLPLGDGAYIQGDAGVLEAARQLSVSPSTRWAAMDSKRDAARGFSATPFRSQFIQANDQLEASLEPRAATQRTRETVRALPYATMAAARQRNAETLRRALAPGDVRTLPTSGDEVPSHLVLTIQNPRDLQRELAGHGIFCAVHWPEVSHLQGIRSWRSDLLSVPIDHRYGQEDMERVAAQIIEVLS